MCDLKRCFLFVLALISWGGPALGQAPGLRTSEQGQVTSQAQEPTGQSSFLLHVESKLVVLDVVVADQHSKPVRGLHREDFNVYEDKVPQKILSFEPAVIPGAAVAPVPIHSTGELDRLEPQAPVSIIVLDEVTSMFEDQAFARYSLKKYLGQEGDTLRQPTMLIAAGINHQMVLRDYTTSKKEILDALDHHFASVDWRQQSGGWETEQFNAAFASLIGVAQATAGHPGHKNLVWIGRGFPSINWDRLTPEQESSLRQTINICTNLLRDSRVTLYSIDPAGLPAEPPATDAEGFDIGDPFGGEVDFDEMARVTGGQAFHGRNDTNNLIGTSISDGQIFYTIAYRPTSTSSDPKEFRKIQVLMKDRTLTATTREGYFAVSEPLPPTLNDKHEVAGRTKFDIVEASEGLMLYDGIPLTILRKPDNPDSFDVQLPASALQWVSDGEKRKCDVLLVMESFGRNGKLIHSEGRVFGLVLPARKEQGVESRTVTLPMTVSTAQPAARLRVIVRANDSGKIGADNFFLVDPRTLKDPSTGLIPKKNR